MEHPVFTLNLIFPSLYDELLETLLFGFVREESELIYRQQRFGTYRNLVDKEIADGSEEGILRKHIPLI